MDITFTNTFGASISKEFYPKPASQQIPEWYKIIDSYTDGKKQPDGNGSTTATIKRCMPVFDSINQGYIISTYVDIFITQRDGTPWYEWSNLDAISFHPIKQASEHPSKNGFDYPKLMNPWGIKTPRGYSTMFIAPVHRSNIFTILPGVVDTDTYTAPVNFPMVLTDINFTGLIPAGTPIAQVIPFKRDKWKMQFGGDRELKEIESINANLRTTFFDRYKNKFRISKEYK
jgi:hypothetical protein